MIRLKKYKTDPIINIPHRHVWTLKVTAEYTADDSPAPIFVYSKKTDGLEKDMFECVATTQQLDELPDNNTVTVTGDDGRIVPYYRQNEAIFNCRSQQLESEMWAVIQEHVKCLVANIKATNALIPIDEVEFT